MSGWPVSLGSTSKEGTAYVGGSWIPTLIDRHGRAGQAWRFGRHWTTYTPNRAITFKSYDRLGPKDEGDFWRIMECCEGYGLDPPTSFSDIFLQLHRPRRPKPSVIAPLWGTIFGGWQEVKRPGPYNAPVWHYDINKAYRWASLAELPDMESSHKVKVIGHHPAVYLLHVKRGQVPWLRREGVHAFTSEEIEALSLRSCKVVFGVAFRKAVSLSETWATIDTNFPYCRDRISRSFWGIWNGYRGPVRMTYKSGEKQTPMQNIFYNPVWASFITSRVKLKVLEHWEKSLHCFVDSILTTEPIKTGEGMGEFRLLNEYSSVWIEGPGIWGSGDVYIKQAGTKRH